MAMVPFAAVALAALVTGGAPPTDELTPQIATDRIYLTFECQARVPGASLTPGTYLFVIVRAHAGQSLLDVYAADASRHLARFLAVESDRVPDTPAECNATPRPRRGWAPTPYATGLEFVYSRTEAIDFARTIGEEVPYSVLPVDDFELVGAYPVAGAERADPFLTAGAGALVTFTPQPSRLGAWVARSRGEFSPGDHLVAARLIAGDRADAVPEERTLFLQVGVMLDAVQRAARGGDAAAAERLARGVEATLINLNPSRQLLAKNGILPPPRDFVLTLEQIGAHVRAFTRRSAFTQRAAR